MSAVEDADAAIARAQAIIDRLDSQRAETANDASILFGLALALMAIVVVLAIFSFIYPPAAPWTVSIIAVLVLASFGSALVSMAG